MSNRSTHLLLQDILDASDKIITYTHQMNFIDFIDNDVIMDAVTWNFGVIGEAARNIPQNFKNSHPEIEWRELVGFRDRIVHAYFEIDYDMVWKIREKKLAALNTAVEQIINNLSF